MVGDIPPCCPNPDCRDKISAIVRAASKKMQTNKQDSGHCAARDKSFKFCHRKVEDPREEVGGLSSERGIRVIAQKNPQLKAQWDSYA